MSISANITFDLAGNTTANDLSLQVTNLEAVATGVVRLIENPPSGIDDFLGALNTLPLPDIAVGGELAGTLISLQELVPTDLSSITASVTGMLAVLGETLGGDLVDVLEKATRPVLAIVDLLNIDLSCLGVDLAMSVAASGPAGAGAGGGGTTEPAGGGAGAGGTPVPAGGGAQPAAPHTTLDQIVGALDTFPSPLTLDALIAWMVELTDLPYREQTFPVPVPFLDDVRDSLATLLAWDDMNTAQIAGAMESSLNSLRDLITESISGSFGDVVLELGALSAESTELDEASGQLLQALSDIAAGGAGGQAAAAAAIVRLDERKAALSAALATIPSNTAALSALPNRLRDALDRIELLVQIPGYLPVGPAGDATPAPSPQLSAEVNSLISPVVAWFQDLLAALDLSAVEQPIQAIADGAEDAVGDLNAGIVGIETQVQLLLGQVTSALDGIDVAAVTAEVTSAIQNFSDGLVDQIGDLFRPVREVLTQALGQISTLIDQFNPGALKAQVEGLIDILEEALGGSEVTGAVGAIQGALDTATGDLGTLSFTPVTDPIVDQMDQITLALKAIQPSLLSPPLALALQAAVMLLPDDLSPITNPLEGDFELLVDEGPKKLIGQVKPGVDALFLQVRAFEPATLLGDALSGPFNQLITTMEGFTPSRLLEPIRGELEALRTRLAENASPGRLLEPLEAPFAELRSALDRLNPAQLIEPINAAITEAVDTVLAAVPVESALEPMQDALARIQGVAELGALVISVLQKVRSLLAELADGPDQVDAWISAILDKAAPAGHLLPNPVQEALEDIKTSLEAVKQEALTSVLNGGIAAAGQSLDAFKPQDRLTELILAYRNLSPAARLALPSGSDPTSPDFQRPFSELAGYQVRLGALDAGLDAGLSGWDGRYFGPNSVLTCLGGLAAGPPDLRTWLERVTTPQIVKPLRALVSLAAPALAFLDPVIAQTQALIAQLNAKLSGITGTGSLSTILDSVQDVVDLLQGVDLDSLGQSLDTVFSEVLEKVEALDPAALALVLDGAFAGVLATLDLEQVLPAADLAKLDADFLKLIAKLKLLDPSDLVADLQALFDANVLPLIEALDISVMLEGVLEMLERLKLELHVELERVNEAYKAMLAAVPSMLPFSIDIDIDIEIESPF